jgi:hypothetical protein
MTMHFKLQLAFAGMALLVFVGNVAVQYLGWWVARRRPPRDERSSTAGTGAIEASVFALLGLLVAFSFAGAEGRLVGRRDLIVREAGAIDTAYRRLDVLPEPARSGLKEQLRRYLDSRIGYYNSRLDREEIEREHARSDQLQEEIWAQAVRASEQASDQRVLSFVLPAINEMIDVRIAREAALRTHVPLGIFIFLAVLSFACALVAGMNMAGTKPPSPLHVYLFAGTIALTFFIILNVEFPRAGLFPMRALDEVLVQLRATMS